MSSSPTKTLSSINTPSPLGNRQRIQRIHQHSPQKNKHLRKKWKLSQIICIYAIVCIIMIIVMVGLVIIPISSDIQDDILMHNGSTNMSRIAKRNDFIIQEGAIPASMTITTTTKRVRRGANLQSSDHSSFSLRRYFIQWMFPELDWADFQKKQHSHTFLHHDKSNNQSNTQNNLQPQIAWLMSFPNSGTSYTLHLVHGITNTSVGTNYEKEVKKDSSNIIAESVHSSSNYYGPFVLQPHFKLPPSYILTKTHCSGYCNDCPIEKYVVDRYQFAQGCATNVLTPSSVNVLQQKDQIPQEEVDKEKTSGKNGLTNNYNSTNRNSESISQIELSKKKRKSNNEKKQQPNMMQNNILYNYQIEPKRTIRLVRDPFSNIVSNFHHWIGKQTKHKSGLEKEYTDDFKGFQKYCQWYNLLFEKQLKQLIEFGGSNSGGGGIRGTSSGGGRKHLYGTSVWEAKRIFRQKEMRELMKLVPCHQHFFRYISVSFYFVSLG